MIEEMEALTVRMDDFQEYLYHVGMPHPLVGRDGRGREWGQGRGRDNERE